MKDTITGLGASPVPVTVLTGYLGAGKPTLLTRILRESGQERVAVIENEIGAVDIDGELVVRTEGDVVVLRSGCLCCNVRTDLVEALRQLYPHRHTIDRLVIETSGLAAPAPVAETIVGHAELIGPGVEHINETGGVVAGALPLLYGMAEGIVTGVTPRPEQPAVPEPARPASGTRRSRLLDAVGFRSES